MTTMISAIPAPGRSESGGTSGKVASDGADFARELAGAQRDVSGRDSARREDAGRARSEARDDLAVTRAARDRADAVRDRADAARDRAADQARARQAHADQARADKAHMDRGHVEHDADARRTDGTETGAQDKRTSDVRTGSTKPDGQSGDAVETGASLTTETDVVADAVADDGEQQNPLTAAPALTDTAAGDGGLPAESKDAASAAGTQAAATQAVAAQATAADSGPSADETTVDSEVDVPSAARTGGLSAVEGEAVAAAASHAEGDVSDEPADPSARQRGTEQFPAGERAAQAALGFVKATEQAAAHRPSAPTQATASVDGTAPAAGLPAQASPTANVATASAPAPVPATPATPLASQLTGQLTHLKQLPQGEHVLTLSVNPETFGPVKVVAHITSDNVSIQLFGASDASREALRGALADLRRDLAATGLQADLDLGTDQGPQGGPADQGDGLGQRRGTTAAPTSIRLDGPQEPTAPTLATSRRAGGVDLMI